MKHSNHLITTTEALQRVFFPSLRPTHTLSPLHCRLLPKKPPITHHQRRHAYVFKSRQVIDQPQTPETPIGPAKDEEIESDMVQVVNDETSRLQPPEPVSTILSYIDRKAFFLVQVSPPAQDGLPVCKILPKSVVRKQIADKLRPPSQKNPKADKNLKQLEVGWVIDVHDLKMRMRQMKAFLEEGRRVEVVLGKRRRGWMGKRSVPQQEMMGMLEKIRGFVGEVAGAREWKKMEGEMGGEAMLFFEGPKVEKKKKKKEKEREEQSPA